jgi:hypothetical protein
MPPYRTIEIFSDANLTELVDMFDGVVETQASGPEGTPSILRITSKYGAREFTMPRLVAINDSGFVVRAFEPRASGTLGGVVERFFLMY